MSNGASAHNRTFKKRWALAVFSRPGKPAGAVAMAFKIYTEMDANGEGAIISDEDFRVCCGVSDGSCRVFKRWLVANDLIKIVTRGQRGRSSKFMATIPATGAGVQVETAADAATIRGEEYRRSSPVIENEIPAIGAAVPEMPAHAAAIAPSRALTCAPSRAHFELPSEVHDLKEVKPPLSPMPTFGHASAVTMENGQIVLKNGLRQFWLDKFEGDAERLDLALMQARPYVQENSRRPLEAQVSAQLARAVADKIDRDKRYASAAQANGKGPKEGSTNRTMRIGRMLEEQNGGRS